MDLTRQVLSKLANQVFLDAVTAFKRKDLKALNLHSKKIIQLIKDIDILLTSDDNFYLERGSKVQTSWQRILVS